MTRIMHVVILYTGIAFRFDNLVSHILGLFVLIYWLILYFSTLKSTGHLLLELVPGIAQTLLMPLTKNMSVCKYGVQAPQRHLKCVLSTEIHTKPENSGFMQNTFDSSKNCSELVLFSEPASVWRFQSYFAIVTANSSAWPTVIFCFSAIVFLSRCHNLTFGLVH